MAKNKIEIELADSKIEPTKVYTGEIIEIRKDCVVAIINGLAQQLIPMYRFVNQKDIAKLRVGAKIKLKYYYSNALKPKLLAYNVEVE